MLITALKQLTKDRYTVVLDSGAEIKTSLGVVTDLRLFAGKELDAEALAELRRSSARSLARDRALELVSRRMLSCAELREKLLQKGEDEETAAYCVQWLAERGFLNDGSYAAAVTRHYAAKGYGPGRVRAELQRRGVPRELWEDALEAMPGQEDKLEKFISARLKDPADREQVRKLSAALFRRGYSWEEIRSALERHHAETEEF